MQELTHEWVSKAENDFAAADMTLHSSDAPIIDVASFHCQQCAEKYLKAFLQEKEIEFPRQHDLIPLMELCKTANKSFETLRQDLGRLDRYAVAIRYPGAIVTVKLAEDAFLAAERVRKFIRKTLGLK